MEEEVKDGERGEKDSSMERIEKGQTNNLSNIYHREFTWTKGSYHMSSSPHRAFV